jgi:hypothetical protein
MLRHLASSLFLASILAGAAAAQCPFTGVTTQNYGGPCTTVFPTPPTISATLDPVACSLGIRVVAFAGCCNTYLRDRILAIGLSQANMPVPQVGVGCTLLVNPLTFLWQPVSMGDTFTLAIPAGLTPFTFQAQGGSHYFTTIGLTNDLQLTDGLTLTLF